MADALVLTLLPHGEHGAVVRFLGREQGLVAAFVHGARSRRRRADLAPGNRVALRLTPRSADTLPSAAAELIASRALLAFAPGTAAALDYLVHLPTLLLPEGMAEPHLYDLLDGLLDRLDRPGWEAEVARFELLLLAHLGFGLDLGACALTGSREDLVGVSPRTGRAVCRAAAEGQPWAASLLALPQFLVQAGAVADGPALARAFQLTGHFIARQLVPLAPRLAPLRQRMLDLALAAPLPLSPCR
jgi:DNA repair protein RecO (recombination protein O)